MMKHRINPWPQQFMQLSSMLDAGLSVEHALKTLHESPSIKRKKNKESREQQNLKKVTQQVSRGSTLSTALKANKVIDKFDAALLENAETAGRIPQGLDHISTLKLGRQKMISSLSSLALFPKAMLIIGAFAGIFVRIARQGQAPTQAVIDVSIVLVLTVLAIKMLIFLLTINARIPLSFAWNLRFIKKHSKAFQQHFEQRFYHSFFWQIASGIDSATAIKNNALLLNNKTYQKTIKLASNQASRGIALPNILEQNGLLLSPRLQQTLSLADTAGTAEKAISHELKLIKQEIKQRNENLISWWPKALYVSVLAIIMRFMF